MIATRRLRPMPLDKVSGGPVVAFAMQRLFTSYGGYCCNVRRSSDNATADIGFDQNGMLDAPALLAHCGAGDGFVVTWYDQSGNSRNATQATTTKQAKLVSSGVVNTLGNTNCLSPAGASAYQTASINLTGLTAATVFTAIQQIDASALNTWIEHGPAAYSAGGGWSVVANNTTLGSYGGVMASNTAAYVINNCVSPVNVPRDFVARTIFDTSQSTPDARLKCWLNGDVAPQVYAAYGGTPTSSVFSNQVLNLFARNNGSSFFANGKCFAVIAYSGVMPAADCVVVEKFLCDRVGTLHVASTSPLSFSNVPTVFDFTDTNTVTAQYIRSNNNSEVSYVTSATSVIVNLHNTIASVYSAKVGVFVDGVYHSALTPSANGISSHTLTLSAGSKTVTLRSGWQSKPSTVIIGTWVTSVYANAAMTRTTPTLSGGLTIYGDSIAAGSESTTPTRDSWAMKTRASAVGVYPVTNESYGYRSLWDDANTSGLRAALVAAIAVNTPTKIWLAIGTNDYGLNKWSAASFETKYAALLVDLNAALPAATIYAQTPIVRGNEVANGSGSTLSDYRTAISNAASGKGYVTLVDGTLLMTSGGLVVDGVHPSTAGHATIAAAIKTILGL